MQVLLDTHALLWALSDSDRLSKRSREVIVSRRCDVVVSVVSAIEIAIKSSLGKLEVPDDLEVAIEKVGFRTQDFNFGCAEYLKRLPWHHRDPFDRMLIAQAQYHKLAILSRDSELKRYNIEVVW